MIFGTNGFLGVCSGRRKLVNPAIVTGGVINSEDFESLADGPLSAGWEATLKTETFEGFPDGLVVSFGVQVNGMVVQLFEDALDEELYTIPALIPSGVNAFAALDGQTYFKEYFLTKSFEGMIDGDINSLTPLDKNFGAPSQTGVAIFKIYP